MDDSHEEDGDRIVRIDGVEVDVDQALPVKFKDVRRVHALEQGTEDRLEAVGLIVAYFLSKARGQEVTLDQVDDMEAGDVMKVRRIIDTLPRMGAKGVPDSEHPT